MTAGSAAEARPAAQPGRRPPLPSLTGLRFFAALLVFFFHSSLSNSPIPPNAAINPFADHGLAGAVETLFSKSGYVGVSFFFVLSGFVLAWVAKPGERPTAFWRRRLVKIFPNHLVVFAAAMVLWAGSSVTGVGQWLPNLFLLHTFFPQPQINLSVNPPTWSLGSELLFYALFPLIVIPIRKIAEKRLWLWAGVMVAGMVGVQLVAQFLIPATPKSAITPISDMQFWFGYLFPPGRVFEFALGIILARLVMTRRWPHLPISACLVLMAAGYGAALLLPFQYGFVVATIIPVGALIATVAQADTEGRPTRMRGPVMQWLGEVSFGFYLVQGVTIFYLRKQLLGTHTYSWPVALAVVALFFAASLLGGWLLHRYVEMPAMRRWSRSRRRPAPASSAPVSSAVAPAPAPAATVPAASAAAEPVQRHHGTGKEEVLADVT
ncbi:acyltransferase 3 [Streptantibioticus cattleyicolor NRRL 8057 = DSM 46488]|uniref:Acyltransferase 3 n=1 Tax=Streptantibioticus cattleyicolor (strain ATCC 35852 / DSM 46488 / JCM 4925 / NBRC 14057 / NRRL 8057) TaxID=1003195 RepID=G8X1F1_STREN|nr:acyltransferase 3 [Streptantibioticus cattleyicolor NRRL 8057 = DSM 46488]